MERRNKSSRKSDVEQESDRLSGGDALFLHLEREGMPLNVASVSIFEGVIPLEPCIRFIEFKLPLIPRYRQRVVIPPFNIGLPAWEYDPAFDTHNHVHEITLRHGTEAELKGVAGKVLSTVLDRRRPLWDFTIVRGLKGNRTAIITRMHHCLADGLAGVALLNALMDTTPKVPRLPKRKLPLPTSNPKNPSALLFDGLVTSSFSVVQRILSAQMELLNVVERVLAAGGNGSVENSHLHPGNVPASRMPSLEELTRFMPEVTSSTQRLPFNVICYGPQKYSWAEIPLAEIKAVKNAFGATINDVVLTIMTATIRRYVEMQGVRVRGRLLRFGVPVNIRRKGGADATHLGNQITFIPVTIPLDIRSPRKLLTAIRERVAFLKSAHVAELVGLAGSVLGAIPMAAQVIAGAVANELPLGLCNLVCTNVPGPEVPLYLMSHKLLRCYPYVPIGGDLGLNSAVLTYDGIAHFGFSGNVHAAPKLACLDAYLKTSFAELKKDAGIGSPRAPEKETTRKAKSAIRPKTNRRADKPEIPPAIPITSAWPNPLPQTEQEKDHPTALAV